MDELTELRRLESDTPAPSEVMLTQAFAALTERMDAAEQDGQARIRTAAGAQAPRERHWKLVPIWTTAIVAAAVAVVAVIAVHSATTPPRFDVGAPAATSAEASVPPSPTATATARPDYEFDLSDAHDVARANAELACYHSHGVKIVGLTKPDKHGIAYIEYGGVHNDQQSIALGLQYQKVCDAAGNAVNR